MCGRLLRDRNRFCTHTNKKIHARIHTHAHTHTHTHTHTRARTHARTQVVRTVYNKIRVDPRHQSLVKTADERLAFLLVFMQFPRLLLYSSRLW
jgi:hypothetical protein